MACSGGYMGHVYGADNRCTRCHAWRPSFAPKKQYTKPRAECQVCEREQACDSNGTLGHHGYRRPGWGFITDDCRGVDHKPFPAYDALVKWLAELNDIENTLKINKSQVESDEVASFVYEYKTGFRFDRQTFRVTVAKGAAGYYDKQSYHSIPSYDEMKRRALVSIESQLRGLPGERKRIEARIRKAKSMKK